jgi:ubiquinone/menaquinone biosynthesis C-methylase UbiE
MADARRTYDRIAPVYDILDGPYEKLWKRRLRAEVFRGLRGSVLDAGAGTGCNIAAYPPDARVTAVDASAPMLARARLRAARAGVPVEFRCSDLTNLDVPDASFDAVVATFVFMCMPHPVQRAALSELARVCKPGGEIRLVDYCLSQRPLVRAGMTIMSPWLKFTFAGTYQSETERHFEAAALECIEERLIFGDVVRLTILKPIDRQPLVEPSRQP